MLRISLVPVRDVDLSLLSGLAGDLRGIFEADVEICTGIPHAPNHFVRERNQYLADGLLDDLARAVRSPGTVLIAVTGGDLFSPGLNFVFGIANRGRALISAFRLRPEFYGLEPEPAVLRRRVLVEAVHELGHALGLGHCEFPGCVMFFSNRIGDTDRKGPGFCFRCARALERLVETEGA